MKTSLDCRLREPVRLWLNFFLKTSFKHDNCKGKWGVWGCFWESFEYIFRNFSLRIINEMSSGSIWSGPGWWMRWRRFLFRCTKRLISRKMLWSILFLMIDRLIYHIDKISHICFKKTITRHVIRSEGLKLFYQRKTKKSTG